MPFSLNEGIPASHLDVLSPFYKKRQDSFLLSGNEFNGPANQDLIWVISTNESSAIPDFRRYCRSLCSCRVLIANCFFLTATLSSFLLFPSAKYLPLFLRAASPLTNGRCSPRAAVHDHHPLALIRQRSHRVVACSFERVWASVTRDGGRAAGCSFTRAAEERYS